ncbi:hypothetical protein [Larsenimonas suaedae]|uniref:Type II toxin-antitoxin system VapB family antitoxin n=1 Tax=Larsenimonas suaedae TaxID=1851019 RepID=A0ABU1GZ78_9GAMM|nr:hypothetical protein [Larsenimonas suaedae]MCM2973475.1 hypothetical protein [Larsenimonas suaedae]MDR5897349.1 hypothetical protein [Larsenimonas suaedae]
MYQDTRRLKSNRIGINLDEFEDNLIDALATYTGVEKATLVREMVMRSAMDMLGVSSQQEFDAISLTEFHPIATRH